MLTREGKKGNRSPLEKNASQPDTLTKGIVKPNHHFCFIYTYRKAQQHRKSKEPEHLINVVAFLQYEGKVTG